MEHTILWIILSVVTVAIVLMLTLWKREEPVVIRKPKIGDTITVLKMQIKGGEEQDSACTDQLQIVKVTDNGCDTHTGLYLESSGIYTYQLQSDGKLYKW